MDGRLHRRKLRSADTDDETDDTNLIARVFTRGEHVTREEGRRRPASLRVLERVHPYRREK